MDFPTRVGMARLPRIWVWISSGFPHPRGDGPVEDMDAAPEIPISPPAWGWPAHTICRGSPPVDFPTRVGMARSKGARAGPRHGFPHPRGDGPICRSCRLLNNAISPPAWGWPGKWLVTLNDDPDFPTRVGMARFRFGFGSVSV